MELQTDLSVLACVPAGLAPCSDVKEPETALGILEIVSEHCMTLVVTGYADGHAIERHRLLKSLVAGIECTTPTYLTPAAANRWLDQQELSAATRREHGWAVGSFFAWGIETGRLPHVQLSDLDACPPPMRLLDLLNDFYFAGKNRSSSATVTGMSATVAMYSRWLGHEATLFDLTLPLVKRFAAHLRGDGGLPQVADSRQAHLKLLAKFAERLGRGKLAAKLGLSEFRFLPSSDSEPDGSLRQFVEEVYFPERGLFRWSKHTQSAVRMYSRWLGRPAVIRDLTEAILSRFLLEQIRCGKSIGTAKNLRVCLVAITRCAEKKGLLQDATGSPRLLRTDRFVNLGKPMHPTHSIWTADEVRRLIQAASRLPGKIPGTKIRRGLYWPALLATMHDTGLRRADLELLRHYQINSDGVFRVVKRKTGKPVDCAVHSGTLALINATFPSSRKYVFGHYMRSKTYFDLQFARIVRDAGLEGTFRKLRYTSSSLIDYSSHGALFMQMPMPPCLLSTEEVSALVEAKADRRSASGKLRPLPEPPAGWMMPESAASSTLTIRELLNDHYIPAKIDLADATVVWLTGAVNLFEKFLGRPAVVPDLNDMAVCRFMRWLLDNGRSARTANARRCGLVMLWGYAFRKRLLPVLPTEVPKAKEPKKVPTSWTDEQFAQIIQCCEQHQESETGKILKAVLLTAWDTDCRIGAIMAAKHADLDENARTLLLYETKTRTQRSHNLSDATVAAIVEIDSQTPMLFGWTINLKYLRRHLTAVLKSCGLPATRRDKFHKIRRTKYTRVLLEHGERAASTHAGHSTNMSAHYFDSSKSTANDMSKTIPPPQKSAANFSPVKATAPKVGSSAEEFAFL